MMMRSGTATKYNCFSLRDTFSFIIALFCLIMALQISVISWPTGRPSAERRGGAGGGTPPDYPETIFLISKKIRLSFLLCPP